MKNPFLALFSYNLNILRCAYRPM